MIDAGCRKSGVGLPFAFAVAAALASAAPARAQAPVAGQNVNMVSDDPLLQRDNEPSLATSSLNPERVLAGANTYRTVDLPDPATGDTETGDAWLAMYKSVDGGRTWKTFLLNGYSQDLSPEGAASPLKQRGLRAAADPTVRAGTNGFFGMSGIAFNRDSNDGVIFFARFIDLDLKENGDAATGFDSMPYVDTTIVDSGNAGQFLDKPWFLADIPRPFASGTCTISTTVKRKNGSQIETIPVTRTFTVGPMYLAWSRFTGSQSTKIMVSRSLDCGKTWATATKVSEGNSINQGTALAVDPQTGTLYVAWRRFQTNSQTDAILVASSTDGGQTFPSKSTKEIASFVPFDQGTSSGSFRTNALPTIAVSVSGGAHPVSRVHVAWAQRDGVGGTSHIVVSTSSNGGSSWSAPAAVDTGAAVDEVGQAYKDDQGQTLALGHQFMPQMTFSGGKLMLLYYDLRLDHTTGSYEPHHPFAPDGTGRYYEETRERKGELLTDPSSVHREYIDDSNLTVRRHTLDLRVAQATPAASPAWVSTPVSRFPFGVRQDATGTITALKQLKVNPPNLPLFQKGTVPFIGDYIDITGESFYAASAAPGKPWCADVWCYRVEAQAAPVYYATWTSNEDVRPPADGDWTHYTPVGPASPSPSTYDPSQERPGCVDGQAGMRNQNVYASRISQGLLVTSPQANKPLSANDERAFVVIVTNDTSAEKVYRMSIAGQPPGGRASFLASAGWTADNTLDDPAQCAGRQAAQDGLPPDVCYAIDVTIPPHSGAARSVFAKSTSASAQLTVNVAEYTAAGPAGTPVANGLSGFVLLNAVPLASLVSPDDADNIDGGENYDPTIAFINVSNPNVSNVNVSNINVSNVNVSNINVSNPNVSNVNVSNEDIANINVSNVNVSNQPISDASYSITNTGNTTHSYHVQLVGQQPGTTPIQLILTKPYVTPTTLGCDLSVESRDATLASIAAPEVVPPSELGDPDIPDSSVANATLSLAPGETAVVTIRGRTDVAGMEQVITQLTPAIVAHGTYGVSHPTATLLLVATSSADLQGLKVGQFFSITLQSIGGTQPIQWSVTSGQLPPGLSLTQSVVGGQTVTAVSGTPSGSGTFDVEVTATDSGTPTQTATRSLTFTVQARTASAALTLVPSTVAAGAGSAATFTVTDTDSGTPAVPAGDVTIGGAGVLGGTCTLSPIGPASSSCGLAVYAAAPGTYTVTATWPGDGGHAGASASASLVVLEGETRTTITSDDPDPSTLGQVVVVTVAVTAVNPVVGTPTGTVTVSDAAGASCSFALPATSCSITPTTAGARQWTASYGGDSLFGPSSDSVSHTVALPPAYLFTGFQSPLAAAAPYPQASVSGSWNFSRVLPLKWQLQDQGGSAVTSASTVTALLALFSNDGACKAGPAPALPPTPYTTVPGQVAVLYTPAQGAAGGSDFRPGSTYNFNWDATKNASKGCWSVVLMLDDGRAYATKVQLK